ncbi:hypothetical protein JIQ42_03527 [Leishmania sp. Namibia]|uniref:hypothetical protein n=1 Tax=Leishmania sp. Namibia TaxID=2802991 RepID=UPI001B66FC8B|nr:hypothetical protein JIQ42_03527 [Leishmania sp. Namibia]
MLFITISDFVLDEAAWPPACATGALLGCAMALLCAFFFQCLTSSSAALKETVAPSSLSRRDRAAKLLEVLSTQCAAAAVTDRVHPTEVAPAGEDSWESTTTGTSDEDSASDDADSEYVEMEAARLKMVFVVRSGVQPKLTTQEVVVLIASAGIKLVELLQKQTNLSAASHASVSAPLCAADSREHHRWRHWYLWWNRIGCGKISLRCPDKDTMELIVAAAQESRLPMVQLRRSERAVVGGAQTDMIAGTPDIVCVALGPAPSDVLGPITGSLKLFS